MVDDRRNENARNGGVAGPAPPPVRAFHADGAHVVFDFTRLDRPGVRDLSLVLTARLRARPEDRVWARALAPRTRLVLRGLGLDHLFRVYPAPLASLH